MSKRTFRTKPLSIVSALMAACVAVALALVGCGSGSQESVPANEHKEPEGVFEGREKRDSSELDEYVEKALALGEERGAADSDASKDSKDDEDSKDDKADDADKDDKADDASKDKDKEEAELTLEQADTFAEANEFYRDGKYKQAQTTYEKIIKAYPQHYGANINLTLAMLHLEENDDALVQALACVALYPEDDGTLLNVQAAAVACGFSTESALEDAALAVVHKIKGDDTELPEGMEDELEYNKLWDDIETELYDVAQGKASNGSYVYENLMDAMDKLVDSKLVNDDDAEALRAYLIAVGTQLELEEGKAAEKDAEKAEQKAEQQARREEREAKEKAEYEELISSADIHKGLPYIVADDDVCTIVFTGYHMSSENPIAEFSFINNSDKTLTFSGGYLVTGNGKEIEELSAAWPAVEPGKQGWAWGNFFGTEDEHVVSMLDSDLTSLSCILKVGVKGGYYGGLGSYPLKWEADAAKAGKEIDKKIIDNESDITIELTRILPASDGIVAVEYRGTYKGEGDVLYDGKDFKVNGKDVEIMGAGSLLGTSWAGHDFLLFRAKNADDLREGDVTSLSGTLVLSNQDGNELLSKQLDVSFTE